MHSGYGTRLLSIGEIFDRAVHLTIANLLPLAAIVGLVAVPVRAIADWIGRDGLSRSFGAAGKIVADPRSASTLQLVQSHLVRFIALPNVVGDRGGIDRIARLLRG
jgi:hypothetical protein